MAQTATRAKQKSKKKASKAPKSAKASKKAPARAKATKAKVATPKAPPPGPFVWHELMTNDLKGAKDFYSGLFGWTPTDVDMGSGPYALFKKGGTEVAGGMGIRSEMGPISPHWLQYVGVADVDASSRKAQILGAKLHAGPMDIPGIGRFAVLQDPQGAAFALFRPSKP